MEKFDIIIAGGGPAGLIAADDLSKKYKVLVIEKNKPGKTNATWYSYADRSKANGLDDAVAVRTPYIKFTAPSVTHYMKDDCVIFDHQKVMRILLNRVINQGVKIIQDEFGSYNYKGNKVIVKTNKGEYSARLLIDSMGINSKIVQTNKLVKRKDAWVIYGARIKNTDPNTITELEYYPLNDEDNTYVGVHPLGENETNFYVFKGVKNTLGNPDELIEKFDSVLKEAHPGGEKVETLKGSIVSGILKKDALDRVIFFGSSGMLNPDGCGMGFNEILLKHAVFSKGVSELMEKDELDQKSLTKVAKSLKDKETLHFQRIIGAFSLNFIKSPGKWDGGVKWLNAMGENSKYWMRNEMTMDWIMTANLQLHNVIPIKETFKMIPLDDFFFIFKNLTLFSFQAFRYKLVNKS